MSNVRHVLDKKRGSYLLVDDRLDRLTVDHDTLE
jgi:hypothetical protein